MWERIASATGLWEWDANQAYSKSFASSTWHLDFQPRR